MPATNTQVTLRFLAQPTDVNFAGNVHGGSAMKWLDQAGYVCATGWSGQYCVTVFVGNINFYKPIAVGNLVEITARVIHTGRTSMHIAVDLSSCNPQKCDLTTAIHCIMVFVAVDKQGTPLEVPSWHPVDDVDKSMEAYALRIMELRSVNQEEFDKLKRTTDVRDHFKGRKGR